MSKIVLINTGKRGSVDVDLPGTGREHEMVVTRSKVSDKGRGDEIVKQIVKVQRPHSVALKTGDVVIVDESVFEDPVIASRIREGVLAVRKYRETQAVSKPASQRGAASPAKEKSRYKTNKTADKE